MRQLQSRTAVSPTTTNRAHRDRSGLEATLGSSGAFSSSLVAKARATCRIAEVTSFRYSFPPRQSVPRRRQPGSYVSGLFPARVSLSLIQLELLVPLRLLPALVDQSASSQPRAWGKHLSRSRAVLRESVTATVRRPGGRATAVRVGPGEGKRPAIFWEICFKTNRGGFLRAPRVFAWAYLVYRNYFSLLCFSFLSRKAAPTRTDQPPVSVPLFYTRQWW